MKTKGSVRVSILAGLFLALAILPGTLQAEETVKIGILAPFDFPTGKGIRWAAEMAAEEINSQGGMMGKQIELRFADTKSSKDIGTYGYVKLASQDKVAAVIGPGSSEISVAAAEQMAVYKVPFLVVGASTSETTDRVQQNYDKYKYLFKVFHSSDELADFTSDWLVNHFAKKRNMKRVALMIENALWTRPVVRKWEKKLNDAGIEIPVFEYVDKNTKDFAPIFSKVKDSRAEAVFTASALMDPTIYVSQWADMKGPVMAGLIGMFPVLGKNIGDKCLSITSMAYPGLIGLTPKDKAFHENYVKKYGNAPEYTSPYTYDAMYMLKSAIERAESTDPDALADALEKTDYAGIMGKWIFDKKSHHSRFGPGYRQFLMIQWQAPGKICVIWPEESKTCDFILPPWYAVP